MIHNARQYRITKAQAAKFAATLQSLDERPSAHPGVHPKLIKAQRDALASQLESLNEEINQYEMPSYNCTQNISPNPPM